MKNIIILFFISNLMTTISHAGPSLSLCFDGNCETKKLVNISDEDWSNILEIFTLPIAITEEAERECITKAIPLIEKLSLTKLAQTTVDSYSASDLYNSMNSRDQTLNYKAYIRLLSDHHVIQYHSLRKTEHRSSWIGITEYSIIIQDRTSG